MKIPIHYMITFFMFLSLGIKGNEKVVEARENIRKTLLIETELVLKEESWQKEKARIIMEQELLKSKKDAIQKEIQDLEVSIQKAKEEAQSDLDSQKELNNKHQALIVELKESVALLVATPSPLPEDGTLKQIAKSLQAQATNENLNPAVLFDDLYGFHGQWWQMGQSFQIKNGNIAIDGKEYHGAIIRLGLVYQFLLFEDQARWAYYDIAEKKWKFGREEETPKLIKIKNILQKNEPNQIVELPKK